MGIDAIGVVLTAIRRRYQVLWQITAQALVGLLRFILNTDVIFVDNVAGLIFDQQPGCRRELLLRTFLAIKRDNHRITVIREPTFPGR